MKAAECLKQRPFWEGTAGSLALHLTLALALLCPLRWPAQVRLPVREVILIDLVEEEPSRAEGVAVEEKVGPPAAAERPSLRSRARRPREETVSLAGGGKHRKYLQEIKRKIEEGWVLSADTREGDLKLVFSIERSGRLSRVKLLKSSGDGRLDVSALAAVRRAGPFAPMPPQMRLARLHVRASFSYHLASR